MDAAGAHGLHVAGHVSEETLSVSNALQQGQRSIEHVRSHLLLCFTDTASELEELFVSDDWDAEDRRWAEPHVAACPAVWEALRRSDTWLTPTLAVQETLETASRDGFEDDPRRATLPQPIRQSVADRSQTLRERDADALAEVENWNRFIHRFVDRAGEEDVKILAGSDAACEGTIPGFSLHRELELLTEAGLSNLKALQAATLEPAAYLQRQDRSGKLNVGYDADVVLLNGNPLENVRNTQRIHAVIKGGDIVFVSPR